MKTYIKNILELRNNLLIEEYSSYSNEICQKVLELKEYQEAQNLLIFYPYNKEVNVLLVAKHGLENGKNVYFPKVTGSTTMDFIKVECLNDFSEGFKGIFEPIENSLFDKEHIEGKTIMILPGSAFDQYGNRAGYGKGYYDRYLEKCFDKIVKVGVCFSLQMLEKLPDVKTTDIPMDFIINEIS